MSTLQCIEQVELPPRATRAGKGRVQVMMAWMRDNPGVWRVVSTYRAEPNCAATRSRLRKAGFEAHSRKIEDDKRGRVQLYARWPERAS